MRKFDAVAARMPDGADCPVFAVVEIDGIAVAVGDLENGRLSTVPRRTEPAEGSGIDILDGPTASGTPTQRPTLCALGRPDRGVGCRRGLRVVQDDAVLC